MIGTIFWRPHLGTLANSFVVLAAIAWLMFIFHRHRSLHSLKRTWLLMIPKILFTVLLLVAILDPCWRVVRPSKNAMQVALLRDVSTSMDVADDETGARAARARRIAEKFRDALGDWVAFRDCPFDVEIRDAEEELGEDVRGTDLGSTIVSLSQKPELSACKAVVMVTDGGDQVVRSSRMPGAPLYIVGVGSDPSTWNDVAIDDADMPAEVERGAPFQVVADIIARRATGDFSVKMTAVKVTIDKRVGNEFQEASSDVVDLRTGRARVDFKMPAEETAGMHEYRLTVQQVEGETTYLNNVRLFRVDVREKNIYVLLYSRVLDWNYALVKRELSDDPTVSLTALYYKDEEVLRLEGSRQEGDEVLGRGFPTDPAVLGLYKCVILGSFPAVHLRDACYEALKKYVEEGGSVIFLGGPNSFGRGGYADCPAAPLIPWQISAAERRISAGLYPVMVPPQGVEHGIMSATADVLSEVPSPVLYSVNPVGALRSGALGLLNASLGQDNVSVVALQPYGKGQTLGLATDTLWRWGRTRGTLSNAYHQFWRDTIRYMVGAFEGGRFLTVKWDRAEYQPSEQAEAEIHVAGRYAAGEISLKGTIAHGGETAPISITPVVAERNIFSTELFFPERGEYAFNVEAMLGGKPLDTYQRTLQVGSALNEGAKIEVDHAFLESLSVRSGGYYKPEAEVDTLVERLMAKVKESASPRDIPLTSDPAILGLLPLFVLVALLILVGEWIIRRRMNMI